MNDISDSKKLILVALGGNAITREFEEGSIYQQFANTRRSLTGVADLIQAGHEVVITHGNGPQVGNYLVRVEASRHLVPPIPLGVVVADLEGGMGYMIQQTLHNKLKIRGIRKGVITLITQVLVDRNDPSILNPTKFVGMFYQEAQVEELRHRPGWIVKEDPGRGYRRVVPSPKPQKIVESSVIKSLVNNGVIVIAAGGGGIPAYLEEDGELEGIDAVVDKDLASAVLARDIHADVLIILTAVDKVYANFRKPNQLGFQKLTVEEAEKYLAEGQFPPGSMGPKIEASIDFLKGGGHQVLITSVERMQDALAGRTGTVITA
jgi:carbamate kinase